LDSDRIFDFLLSIGMRPLVELSFTPNLLASGTTTWSHYTANITPPKDMNLWAQLIREFMLHLIDRYGIDEIAQWSFEFWNEPNCCPHNFFTGNQKDFFDFYAVTARAAKSVSSRIRIGGPATAMSAWIQDFMTYCEINNVPYDFITTHEYPTDPPGPQTREFFINVLKNTRAIVGPNKPIYYTEYDDGYNDGTPYSAAFAMFQNFAANGVVDKLSWWPFSDLFEEAGLYPDPYNVQWMPVAGLLNVYGIPKPSYRAFQLMHQTGKDLLSVYPSFFASATVGVFAVQSPTNVSVFIVNWNVKKLPIQPETVEVVVNNLPNASTTSAKLFRIDEQHTFTQPLWIKMGSPRYLSPKQVQLLKDASQLSSQHIQLNQLSFSSVSFTVTVQPNSVANVVLQTAPGKSQSM
jgi:xylan 1,4-beta-xylosidase